MKIRQFEGQMLAGDFGGRVRDGELYLPNELVQLLPQIGSGVDTAEVFLSHLLTFPTHVGNVVGWTADELKKATQGLQNRLQGYLPVEFTDPNWRPPHTTYGALPPP